MSVDDVYSAIKGEEDYFILDVRTRDEFEAAHIGGAKLIPVSELENRLDEIPEGKPIIVYCRSGNRSAQAATILVQNGFKEVYNMRGGISAWISKGYPVVK
ncbi:MAG: rhodanese-like domain-containing protein [Actinobacteria bacterium]|nr:rhodanese-like domain-containing protein [Actinomycetota bacterium]